MKVRLTLIITFCLGIAVNSNALMITGSASGSWNDVVSVATDDVFSITNNDTTGGTANFNWGVPVTGDTDSMFSFNGVGSEGDDNWTFNTGLDSYFLLGNFGYRNGTTSNSIGINSVTLDISLNTLSPADLIKETFSFVFSIENTPNITGDAIKDGDIVQVNSSIPDSVFYYDGIAYTLELLGFSKDGGDTLLTDFSSPEGAYSEAGLYGRIIKNPVPLLTSFTVQNESITSTPVPEPSTFLLLAGGLAGLACAFRRRKKE